MVHPDKDPILSVTGPQGSSLGCLVLVLLCTMGHFGAA